MARKILVISGAAGFVGRHVSPLLSQHFDLRLIDVQPIDAPDEEFRICDMRNLDDVVDALAGANALLHLAGVAGDGDFLGEIVPMNLVGVYNAFEGARQGGLDTIVFASSGQVVLGNDDGTLVTTDMPARPIGPYAASKLFGEALGRHYHDRYGLRVFSLRMGWFAPSFSEEMKTGRAGWSWLSPGDLASLVVACIESSQSFGVYFAASRGAVNHWDLSQTERDLGWSPRDDPDQQLGVRGMEWKRGPP